MHLLTPVHVQFQYLETGRTLTFNVHDWDTERILKTFTCIETNMSGTYIYDGWLKMTGISGGVYFTVQSETSYTIANTITGSYDEYQMGIIDITNSLHTIGIQYYDSENRFGTRFGDYSAENTFTFRVDGGFIPSGFTPKNDMSVFYDQNQSPSLTYSMPNATHRLVLGNDNGLPLVHGEPYKHHLRMRCDCYTWSTMGCNGSTKTNGYNQQ